MFGRLRSILSCKTSSAKEGASFVSKNCMDAIFDTGHLQSGLGFFFVRFSRILDKFTDRIYIYKYRCSEVKQILISVFNIFHNDSLRGREVWLFSFLPHFFSAEGSISRCFASSFVYACSFLKINLWGSLYGSFRCIQDLCRQPILSFS